MEAAEISISCGICHNTNEFEMVKISEEICFFPEFTLELALKTVFEEVTKVELLSIDRDRSLCRSCTQRLTDAYSLRLEAQRAFTQKKVRLVQVEDEHEATELYCLEEMPKSPEKSSLLKEKENRKVPTRCRNPNTK